MVTTTITLLATVRGPETFSGDEIDLVIEESLDRGLPRGWKVQGCTRLASKHERTLGVAKGG